MAARPRPANSTNSWINTKVCHIVPILLSLISTEYRFLCIDSDGDAITVDGTIKLCEDLCVDPEDIVLLAVAYELKSPGIGEWNKKGWVEGWKNVGCVQTPPLPAPLTLWRRPVHADVTQLIR